MAQSHRISIRATIAAIALLVLLCAALVGMPRSSHATSQVRSPAAHPIHVSAAAIGKSKARSILLKKVIKTKSLAAGDALIAFGLKRPLKAKTKIHVFRDYEKAITVRAKSWFFWIDDDPKAQFEHGTRFVLINAKTGRVKVIARNWWPVIGKKAPWYAFADYWKSSNWAFSNVTAPAPPAAAARVSIAAKNPQVHAAASTDECAVIIDGSGDAKAGFPVDVANMDTTIKAFGMTSKKLTPPNNNKADFEKAAGDLIKDGCKDVLLFLAGHGSAASITMGTGNYTAAELKALIDKHPTIGFKVVVQACKSGSWVTPLAGKTTLITITSTDSALPSYSADPDTAADPNPNDVGSEFTSGLVEDLLLTLIDPMAMQRVQNCVLSGQSILVCRLHIAYESAFAKDEDAATGREKPQRSP